MTDELVERREIYVPRDLVFDAWSGVDHLRGWYVPGDREVQSVDADPVRGGSWKVVWNDADGAAFAESGSFDAVKRPERLGWSLHLSGRSLPPCDTHVQLRLEDLGGACRIELRHLGLSDPAWRRCYAALWPERIDALIDYFSAI